MSRVLKLLFVLTLASCGGQSASQIASDVAIVASGLGGAIAPLAQVNGIDQATVVQIQSAVSAVQTAAVAIENTTTPTTSQGQALQAAVNAVVTAANGLCVNGSPSNQVIPASVCVGIESAAILMPVIETAIALANNQKPAPQAVITAGITPTQARAYLRSLSYK